KSYEPTGTGESPLAAIPSFVETKCPKCGGPAKRETNTMPQWAGSCWYHIAYCIGEKHKTQAPNSKQFTNLKSQKSKKVLRQWLPVDIYVGGAEHATRHLIYARFWHKFLFDIKVVDAPEPFARLQNVGLILASDGRKMSKRFGNTINPDEIVAKFGADSLRVYEMFMGPFNQAIAWNTDSLIGGRRFLERVWRLKLKVNSQKLRVSDSTESLLHQTIKKVGEDIEQFRFNTAISALMILQNALEKEDQVPTEIFEIFLKLLSPFAPHITEELWSQNGHTRSIHEAPWPQFELSVIAKSGVVIVVQINGKTRGSFEAERGETEEVLKQRAVALPTAAKWIAGAEVRKIIVVPDRLVNIVL
ncbi:MAG: class I tRNA ligase family protein, partial [bacterium]|nr:class I tRNA ligase family protein [bacterium]